MNRLPLALCVLAVLGATVLAVLYTRTNSARKFLETRLTETNAHLATAESRLATATAENASLQQRITALDADLGDTKSRLTTVTARNVLLTREVAQTKGQLEARDQVEQSQRDEISALKRDLADSRAGAASAESVAGYKGTIAELEKKLAAAQDGAAAPATSGASTAVFTNRPESHANMVVSVGPESAFVVVNYGLNHGAKTGQTLSIQRGTDVLATVLISNVHPNFSIAQVRPDSLHGALHKGDSAVLLQ